MYLAISVSKRYDRLVDDTAAYRTPGQLIEGLLHARGWDQEVLAFVLGVTRAAVSHLVTGRRRIDAETALALADVFGVDADRFLDLQKSYDLGKALLTVQPDPGRATRATLFASLPISEMIQRGWISPLNPKDFGHVESALTRFFGVDSVDQIPVLPHAAKKTNAESTATPAQLAWIQRVRQLAGDMVVPRYSAEKLRDAIDKLSTLLFSADEVRNVPKILAEAGIRFVLVESLRAGKIDGVCLWLNDRSPVIGMSLRFDRINNFWFVLRHELEHVLRTHGQSPPVLDVELDAASTDISLEEREANDAASEFCVPKQLLDAFVSRKKPLFAERDVVAFARMLKVHPGIVVGQLQRLTMRYDILRKHLVKIRTLVSPGSVVDGWGDVASVGN